MVTWVSVALGRAVAGMCGERACSMCVRAGLRAVRSRLAGRVSGAAGRLRTGVWTLWCPLAQQFRTPLCILCVCVCVLCTLMR